MLWELGIILLKSSMPSPVVSQRIITFIESVKEKDRLNELIKALLDKEKFGDI